VAGVSARDSRREARKLERHRRENGAGTLPFRVRCDGCGRVSPGGEGRPSNDRPCPSCGSCYGAVAAE